MKLKMLFFSLFALLWLCPSAAEAEETVWFDGQNPVTYQVVGKVDPVVKIALQMFTDDMRLVTGLEPKASSKATIRIVQGRGTDDGFRLSVRKGQIVIEGHNGRGAAYGLLELSRMAGVSPWVWWGDVVPERKPRLTIDSNFLIEHVPSVAYRGIFINDEDWSLRNWAWKHYEKTDQFGAMGPKTYKAIFQLLLRLRANAVWPGMHTGTPGFFTIPGNKEMADSCGILIGTSHCEPLLRNNVAEWDQKERGPYNYITNREQVRQYWIERVKEVKGSEEFFTLGMRGIHDGSMEGVKTKKEKLEGLQQVIDDQREILAKYYDKNVEKVPQVFIPYKEVLEIYEDGLRVPDDVTLMWCDDNYGYMTRLSDEEQQRRQGGGGVYYHLSYWGRPHDYMWLTTTQPGLVYSEMKAAYDHNCRKLWIVNVHDPKVAAYDLELFMDMAWDIDGISRPTPCPSLRGRGVVTSTTESTMGNGNYSPPSQGGAGGGSISQHLLRWLCTQFGDEAGKRLAPAMREFYRLCAIRKPEFMGWTQVELADRKAYPRGRSHVIDTEFSETEFGNEANRYLAEYASISQTVSDVEKVIRPELKDAFFAHVKYPVFAAKGMAEKMLFAQKARSKYLGQTDKAMEGRFDYLVSTATKSLQAYRDIQSLTDYYNTQLAGGKWQGIMNMMPRDLPVFNPPTLPYLPTEKEQREARPLIVAPDDGFSRDDFVARNAYSFDSSTGSVQSIDMLGHSDNAVAIPKGGELVYEFSCEKEGDATLYTAMIPTQPNDKGDLRYSVQVDDQPAVTISLKEKYRSDFWKLSVLRGQALKMTPVRLAKGRHSLRVKAIDDHIIIDQWMIDFKPGRKFYVIPVNVLP